MQKMTGSDFFNWEATQTTRHEFVDGEVFTMAGASETHVTLALHIAMAPRGHLAGTLCRTFITDMKLHLQASAKYFDPDVRVTCSAESYRKEEDGLWLLHPSDRNEGMVLASVDLNISAQQL